MNWRKMSEEEKNKYLMSIKIDGCNCMICASKE